MSLEVSHNKVSQSADCKTVYLSDNTGAYHVTTNPTGYDSPNLSYEDINNSYIEWNYIGSSTIYTFVINNANFGVSTVAFANPTVDNSIAITADLIGGTAGSTITDGIIQSNYYVFYDADYIANPGVTFVSGTINTKTLTFTNGVITAQMYAGCKVLVGTKLFTVASISGVVVTTVETLASTFVSQSYTFGFVNNQKFRLQCNGESCVVTKIADMAEELCGVNCKSTCFSTTRNCIYSCYTINLISHK